MVFAAIDDAGGDGIWTQTLLKRLNMHDKVLRNALKFLTAKDLVKPFKNVEHPNKKMYIKASIQPSERATGGPWFTDQTLDEAFIEEMQMVIFDFIKRESSYHSKHAPAGSSSAGNRLPKKGVLKGGVGAVIGGVADKGKKRPSDLISDDNPASNGIAAAASSQPKGNVLLPMPAGYTGYPTVRQIARFIHKAGITNQTVLSETDVQALVDVLAYDGLIEPVKVAGKIGFRPARIAKLGTESWAVRKDKAALAGDDLRADGPVEPHANGFTEVPCGRCPVFDLCEEGGPVSASNCVYFKKWLGLDLD
jgi:DNA-directed RNA polymerase III subunit RPC6